MNTIFCGIDIGGHSIKAVIAMPGETYDAPMTILGTGTSVSRGLRKSVVVDVRETALCVREAVEKASAQARVPITSARVAMSGIGLDEVRSKGEVTLTASSGIVTERDLDRVIREAEKRAQSKLTNRTVLHSIPIEYRVDGSNEHVNPVGTQGTKLTVDTLLITMLTKHHDDIISAVEGAHIEVEGLMAAPLAATFVTLNKLQKMSGVVLANIGADTVSLIVYENDVPISLKIIPQGGNSLTEKISLTFMIPITEAEQAKRGAVSSSDLPRGKLAAIIRAQTKTIFTEINAHLKSIGRAKLLPSGIVIAGGGGNIPEVADIARVALQIPATVASIGSISRSTFVDPAWAVAFGLCRWAYAEQLSNPSKSLADLTQDWWQSVVRIFKSFLP